MVANRQVAFTKSRITKQRGGRKGHPDRMQMVISLTSVAITGFDGSKSRHRNNLLDIILAMQYMD